MLSDTMFQKLVLENSLCSGAFNKCKSAPLSFDDFVQGLCSAKALSKAVLEKHGELLHGR